MNTISGYYSITPGNISKTINSFQTLGMQYSDKYHGLDQRMGLLTLSGVKYMTSNKEDDVPYGFKKISQDGKTGLYENQYALPLAYAYDTYITENQYNALNGVSREQAMLENIVLEEEVKGSSIKHEKVADNTSVTTIPLSGNRISSPAGEEYAESLFRQMTAKRLIYIFRI